MPFLKARAFRLASCLAALIWAIWPAGAFAQSYTDEELLNAGRKAWDAKQCVTASKFFFAYLIRNPPAVQSNAQHRANVQNAITWCEQNTTASAGTKGDDPHDKGTAGPKPFPTLNLNLPALPSLTAVQKRCDVYARLAIAQNEANRASNCGFTGGRWDSRYDIHYGWCASVPSATAQMESQERLRLLNQCTP